AFGAEGFVANREGFVHDQNIGVGMGAEGKSKPRRHAARIEFDRLIKAIAVSLASTVDRRMPNMAPPIKAFSLPVSSWSNPAPSARIGATRPLTCTLPCVGKVIPQRICNKVVFPAPLRPMIPILSPRRTLKLMSRKTQC